VAQEIKFNYQLPGWPHGKVNRALVREELAAFKSVFSRVQKVLHQAQDPSVLAWSLTQEAVTTSAMEGVKVDESVVMSSICKVLGVPTAPTGFTKDAQAEVVAQMMLAVRQDWNKPLSSALLKMWHKILLSGRTDSISKGTYRTHTAPMRIIRRTIDGTIEVRFIAPPSAHVKNEMRTFIHLWKKPITSPERLALACAQIHPHFESIHPFEDGNGRIGRALIAKLLAQALGYPLVLPLSTILARHRAAYYDELNAASYSLDWTSFAAFFIPILTETLTDFLDALNFIRTKKAYLKKFEPHLPPRAQKVILRLFDDGPQALADGLSAAKWMRIAKVSKPTATRDLAELAQTHAIIPIKRGNLTRYLLASSAHEPNEPINEPINQNLEERTLRLIRNFPGKGIPFLMSSLTVSRATVKRALVNLIAAQKVEHRGSKKTGGYWPR
jgi:Fic family protein